MKKINKNLMILIFLVLSLSVISAQNATREDALSAIIEAEEIMESMIEQGLKIYYVNDTIIEARSVFERVELAEILRGNKNATNKDKAEARKALSLIDWEELSYDSVLKYTDEIKMREEQAYLIKDNIFVLEKRIIGKYDEIQMSPGYTKEETKGIEDAKDLFEEGKIAFSEDRYDDAESYLLEAREVYESKLAETSIIIDIRRGLIGFFQRYWKEILVILTILGLVFFFTYKKIIIYLLKRKIRRMRAEQKILGSLIKKAQIRRFKEGTLSALVYNIRMKKYKSRLEEIKQELPVLESRLRKVKKLNN